MWNNPMGSTGEAAAMRPKSLRQVLTEKLWSSLKRAKHALRLEIQAGHPAFERNSRELPKTQFVERGGEHSSWCSF